MASLICSNFFTSGQKRENFYASQDFMNMVNDNMRAAIRSTSEWMAELEIFILICHDSCWTFLGCNCVRLDEELRENDTGDICENNKINLTTFGWYV